MTLATMRRLPGFAFEVRTPVHEDVLPRMDVAVFVGFAASGPVHVPVPIEDVARFAAVFGPDATLAWDPDAGRMRHGQLGPAVRMFFANGGRRCWVVRVAREPKSNALPLPGLAVSTGSHVEDIAPLTLAARSPGSWADGVSLAASLSSRRIGVWRWQSAARSVELLGPNAVALEAGDLLRVTWPDAALVLYAAVATVRAMDADEKGPRRTRVELGDSRWFDTTRQPPVGDGHAEIANAIVPARFIGVGSPPEHDGDSTISLDLPIEQAPAPGTVIVGRFGSDTVVLAVRDAHVAHAGAAAGSPPQPAVRLRGQGLWTRQSPHSWAESSPPFMTVERLGIDLWARDDREGLRRISDVGLAPGHARHLATLPDDTTVFGEPEGAAASLWRDALDPRFPAAGWLHPRDVTPARPQHPPLCIPFGVGAFPNAFLRAVTTDEPPLLRDGLVPFDGALFAEAALVRSSTTTLMADAEFLRLQSASPPHLALAGLHAALSVDEATLIAIPDAAQPGWFKGGSVAPTITVFDRKEPCDDDGHFADCGALACPPVLDAVGHPEGITLAWSGDDHRGAFAVERATNAEWGDAAVVYVGFARIAPIAERTAGDYFYRVRGIGDRPTAWSNGIAARVTAVGGWRVRSAHEYRSDTLVGVHRMLLRFCGARRDVMAVLSLPEHYRENAAIEHVRRLASSATPSPAAADDEVPPIGFGESDVPGFAAVYHGWLHERDDTGTLRTVAPDGAVSGILARRANERGAWIAPANELLRGVIALAHAADPSRWQELQHYRVNVVRPLPQGFGLLSADTLAPDEDVRPIGVRRLLMLLRRVATRLGANYVFEPNDDAFRRMVQRGFEAMLGELFQRGAFAGPTAATAFQVVTAGALNTPQSVERGRFIVELRIAPSRPLTFLTVRLVRQGERLEVVGA